MINPNFNLLLWVLLITFTIGAVARIMAGCMKLGKDTHYGYGDAVVGLFELLIIAYISLN